MDRRYKRKLDNDESNTTEKRESSNSREKASEIRDSCKNLKRKISEEKNKSFELKNNSFFQNQPSSTKHTNSLDMISISTLLSQHNNVPICLSNLKQKFDNYEPSKHSTKSQTNIRSYSANTHPGIIR